MDIYTVSVSIARSYLIRDKGTIIIDGGLPDKLNNYIKIAQKAAIDPKEIGLIVLTHGHADHIGSAKALKEATGAQIAMRVPDNEWLEKSINQLPSAATMWGRILLSLISPYMRSFKVSGTGADIILGDDDFSLQPFGIPGKVLYTPGHTMGSVSVLLETGDTFIGDLAMNGLPFGFNPILPVFAEDTKMVKESIRLLLDKGAKTFYPGHGKAFPAEALASLL